MPGNARHNRSEKVHFLDGQHHDPDEFSALQDDDDDEEEEDEHSKDKHDKHEDDDDNKDEKSEKDDEKEHGINIS